MAKKKQNKSKTKWVFILAGLAMLIAVFGLSINQFNNAKNGTLSKEEAISKVKALPEVIDYLKRVPNGLVLVNGEVDNLYLVQVYEFINGHTATFNWFEFDKTTGEITAQ